MLQGNILITGGCGTLGKAIIHRAVTEDWPCDITVYSTDAVKHAKLVAMYPMVHSVIGDIRNYDTLRAAMSGKSTVIHAAAVKFIPVSEMNSIDTIDININGSLNVCRAAVSLGVRHVVGISTDKACHPANLYGATKMAMEKTFQEFSRTYEETSFHLVRYGNVLESTGSVVEAWKADAAAGKPIKITDANMTRFWISPKQAVQYVLDSLRITSGNIYVPKMKALSIGKLSDYVVPNAKYVTIPIRPGEKMHETLMTVEEGERATDFGSFYVIPPSTENKKPEFVHPAYSSDMAEKMTKDELMEVLGNE